MLAVKPLLFLSLSALSLFFITRWWLAAREQRARKSAADDHPTIPTLTQTAIGFVTNFFDTLGIGSFATTTSSYKLLRMVPDELIPGTMIVGHALPVVAQALIFISVIQVDSTTLISLIAASIVGGWLGAGVVSHLPRAAIQVGMGIALIIAATFMALSNIGWFPVGGTALVLTGARLWVALAVNALLGALVTLGIGNYGPSLILFSLLGMEPRAAFPIMMGSGAFVATAAGIRFLAKARYHLRAALGLLIGGIPGVLLAAFVVKSLSLETVRWVVVCVVLYTAVNMMWSALQERP